MPNGCWELGKYKPTLINGNMRTIISLTFIFVFYLVSGAQAHDQPCHILHSCPSHDGSYVCGDKGGCSQCFDNKLCKKGLPRLPETKPEPTKETPKTHYQRERAGGEKGSATKKPAK